MLRVERWDVSGIPEQLQLTLSLLFSRSFPAQSLYQAAQLVPIVCILPIHSSVFVFSHYYHCVPIGCVRVLCLWCVELWAYTLPDPLVILSRSLRLTSGFHSVNLNC